MNNDIGGYFELEIAKYKGHYHKNAIKLNTARNALELIIKTKNIKKLHIPYYCCNVILQPILKTKINFAYYHINRQLEIKENLNLLDNEYILYVNYFGLKDCYIKSLEKRYKNLIIDSSQSFFSKYQDKTLSIYNPRKFFGVADGSYLLGNIEAKKIIKQDSSLSRMKHLIGRVEKEATYYYDSFKKNEDKLSAQPIKSMSKLSYKILKSLNYEQIIEKRIKNFNYVHEKLSLYNDLNVGFNLNHAPFVYPFLNETANLRKILIKNKIYIAQYWKEILEEKNELKFEKKFTNYILPLPIDQRYNIFDMNKMVTLIKNYIK